MSKPYRYLFIVLTVVILSAGVMVYTLCNSAEAGLFSQPDSKLDQYSSLLNVPPKYIPTIAGPSFPRTLHL